MNSNLVCHVLHDCISKAVRWLALLLPLATKAILLEIGSTSFFGWSNNAVLKVVLTFAAALNPCGANRPVNYYSNQFATINNHSGHQITTAAFFRITKMSRTFSSCWVQNRFFCSLATQIYANAAKQLNAQSVEVQGSQHCSSKLASPATFRLKNKPKPKPNDWKAKVRKMENWKSDGQNFLADFRFYRKVYSAFQISRKMEKSFLLFEVSWSFGKQV